jgi:hypothetical protein
VVILWWRGGILLGKRGGKAVKFVVAMALGAGFGVARGGFFSPVVGVDHSVTFGHWRAEIRKALYVPDKLPALEAKVWSSFEPMPGVMADRVTYQTSDGMLVPTIVYRPEHWPGQNKGVKLPGVVVVNGHGGDKFTWYALYSGMLFAKAGAEVVTYDPIGEGERNVDRRSHASAHDKIQDAPAGMDADAFHASSDRVEVVLLQAMGVPEPNATTISAA